MLFPYWVTTVVRGRPIPNPPSSQVLFSSFDQINFAYHDLPAQPNPVGYGLFIEFRCRTTQLLAPAGRISLFNHSCGCAYAQGILVWRIIFHYAEV